MQATRGKSVGYTLVEILTVIAIILLLAALLLGVIFMARQYSLRAGCATNLRQLYVALKSYEEDYHKPPPDFVRGQSGRTIWHWDILSQYRPAIKPLLICPADPTEGKRTREDNQPKPYLASYALHYLNPLPLLHPDPRVVELRRWFYTLDPNNPEEVFITCEWHSQDTTRRLWGLFGDGRIDWVKVRSCSLGNGRVAHYIRPVELTEEQCRLLFGL